MSACEKCWRDASRAALLLGGSTADHYQRILVERKDTPCTEDEQKYGEPLCAGCGKPNSDCTCCGNCGHSDCGCDYERRQSDPENYS